jgi:hypothetical protein
VIAQISRGASMPDLVSYLFGPGRHNEHVNQHLVAGYADAVFTADGVLWQQEPGVTRRLRKQARELGWQVDYPRSRWQAEVPAGHVWHCSLSLKAEEGPLTDTQWTQAAHTLVDTLGFSGADGKSPCRWIAVRHGPSADGNDHIHVAVSLVREDGTKASTWNDYRKAGKVCEELEERFGLEHVSGRSVHRSVPEPSRADREISAARGDPEPLRVRLERTVRACAAAASSEARFIALARANGLLIRPRYADDVRAVTGYAVAARDGRQAPSRKTGMTGPIWFGGGKLAADLTLPALRRRWEAPGMNPAVARAEALAAWSAATTLDNLPGTTSSPPRLTGPLQADPSAAADLLAAAAAACEPRTPGPLSQAARHMARAAQQQDPATRRPEVSAVISDMASTFMAIMAAGTGDVLTLVREVAQLVDAVAAATTRTHEATRASVLVTESLATLTQTAARQATATLPATVPSRRNSTKEDTMSEPTYEDEFLAHLTAAGILTARLARTATGQSLSEPADAKALRAAGYTETTPFDDCLRQELGEQRWTWYVADPARIVCAAAITDAARAGHDMPALLARVCSRRAWEDDQQSPARSIARVLYYRVQRETTAPASRPSHQAGIHSARTAGGAPSASSTRARTSRPPTPARPSQVPRTPWDDRLAHLLGPQRWHEYAIDGRRRDVAAQLTRAATEGHDVHALLAEAVTCREWEQDETSPSRRVGSVLHYRVRSLIASGKFRTPGQAGQLPSAVAEAVGRSTAPARDPQDNPLPSCVTDPPPRPRTAQPPQPGNSRG